jgi:hypothetical protein
VTECVVKPLCDVKVTKNPTMLRVGVAQAGCDLREINKKKKKTYFKTSNITHPILRDKT